MVLTTRVRRSLPAVLIGLAVCLGRGGGVAAEIVDRILAVAAGEVITLSDVRGFTELGLIDIAPGRPVTDVVDRLVDRALVLQEVDRYVVSEPQPAVLDGRLQAIRARLGDAEFRLALERGGMSESRLRNVLRHNWRIDEYLAQRFAAGVQPTDEEVARYYREHEADFAIDGRVAPFEEVREIARSRLAEERRQRLIDDWVMDLRQRGEVLRLDRQARVAPSR